MEPQEIADLVLGDLDQVVERARAAYLERIPRLREMPEGTMGAVLEATRRTMRQFCRYYVAGTLDTAAWTQVRDATVERAGEVFSQAEIADIIDVARSVGLDTVERIGETHPELTTAERAKLTKSMDRYLTELAEREDRLRRLSSPSRLDDILGDLEAEGADLQ
jgi:fumarylacetoacetate (FAA) hydrolase family protein